MNKIITFVGVLAALTVGAGSLAGSAASYQHGRMAGNRYETVKYCDVESCTQTGKHIHNYCDVKNCPIAEEHEHGLCGREGCQKVGEHSHVQSGHVQNGHGQNGQHGEGGAHHKNRGHH